MSINYYLIDKHTRHVFDIGQHRHEYANAVRECGTEATPYKTYEEFFEICMEPARKHDAVVPGYSKWVARKAPSVWAFMENANFDVLLLNDTGDDLDVYDECLVVGSVFDDFEPGLTLARNRYNWTDDAGAVRDRDDKSIGRVTTSEMRALLNESLEQLLNEALEQMRRLRSRTPNDTALERLQDTLEKLSAEKHKLFLEETP